MADPQTVIEGTIKYRDSKKWKPRWCVIRKLSPVADCLHLQLYRDSKDRCKNGPTKASLSLEGFLGMETGFTLDKESNTMAIICSEVVVVLAFDSREFLIQWQVKVRANFVEEHQFLVQIAHVPAKSKLASGPARLHLLDYTFCLTAGVPPKLLGIWPLKELRRFGVVEGKFCFEGGSRCVKGEGLHVLLTNQAKELVQAFDMASRGRLPGKRKVTVRKCSGGDTGTVSSLQIRFPGCCTATCKADPNLKTCPSESLATPMSETATKPPEKKNNNSSDDHIRPCHMYYRWPSSCIVPCGAIARDFMCEDSQHRTLARSTPSGIPIWSVNSCSRCGLHSRRDDGKLSQPDEPGFTPQWTMDLGLVSPPKHSTCLMNASMVNKACANAPHDRSSVCSQSSQSSGTSTGSNTSSSSNNSNLSEYSVPKNCSEAFYDRPKNVCHIPSCNRLGTTPEDCCSPTRTDMTIPPVFRGGLLDPIHESNMAPDCTCSNDMTPKFHEATLPGRDVQCTCWNRNVKRNSADMDMVSFGSSSGSSSNASPSTSPKKQPFLGVPILLPCTCNGRLSSNNPYLNYAVPRIRAPVKDSNNCNKHFTFRNITENETVQETKIINRMEVPHGNSEDNGNENINSTRPPETLIKPLTSMPTQLCPCQRLLFCPSGFLPSWKKAATKNEIQCKDVKPNTVYGTVVKAESGQDRTADHPSVVHRNENFSLHPRQKPCMSKDCSGNHQHPSDIAVVNSWKTDNTNHIYVNLKYLQEQSNTTQVHRGTPQRLIPYYANLYFLQTLSLYENSELLASKPALRGYCFDTSDSPSPTCIHELEKMTSPKQRLQTPSSNGMYELMSFNNDSPACNSANYMIMQPGPHADVDESTGDPTNSNGPKESSSAMRQVPPEKSEAVETNLPLRPFMPVLLPSHDISAKANRDSEERGKHSGLRKCESSGECRSARSNSLGDIKMSVLRHGRSSSSDGAQCTDGKRKDECRTTGVNFSPKSTPVRKHTLLTKLTFKSKEKSFSSDEITPPSTVPPSPESVFLESIQRYPFHRSADCLQLAEEYRLSEEDLTLDPDVNSSDCINKNRGMHSIKRSSSVPCKGNPAGQQHSSNGSVSSCQTPGKGAIFSHFIAYHGSLPRRCSGNAASRHPIEDRSSTLCSREKTHDNSNADVTSMIYISECKQCHQCVTSPEGVLVLDTKSMTSSSSSDMSDYIESLSMCSRSSSGSSGVCGGGNGEFLRTTEEISRIPTSSCTSSLRPRSGKEYHSFDRVIFQDGCLNIPVKDCPHFTLPSLKPFSDHLNESKDSDDRADSKGDHNQGVFKLNSENRTNSPSPGYVSSSPGISEFVSPEKSHHFAFSKDKQLNYLEVMSVSESEPSSPIVKTNTVQYAVIDMVATAAAEKLAAERAQLRDMNNPAAVNNSTTQGVNEKDP